MAARQQGVWIPESVFRALQTLRLGSSDWNVLLTMACQYYRYGGHEARIILEEIARRTGLSLSTVNRAIRRLLDRGLVQKQRRGRWLVVLEEGVPVPPPSKQAEMKHVNMVTPSTSQHADIDPTLIISLRKKSSRAVSDESPFSRKQVAVVEDVLREASRLLGRDALGLTVNPSVGDGADPAASRTFAEWRAAVMALGDKAEAGRFVRAVLALRRDPRVVGQELMLEPVESEHGEGEMFFSSCP